MNELFRIIPNFLRDFEGNKELQEALIFAAWKRIAGEKLTEMSKPLKVDEGRLILAVRDATWQKQLVSLSGQLLSQLNRSLGTNAIRFLDFRVEPSLFPNLRFENFRSDSEKFGELIELSPEIQKAASSISDDNLRSQFLATARSLFERIERNPNIEIN